ncbi:hypothetical protein GCM10009830_41530 [Glycomyces endophyticus]|uniref:Uncharacterized protein n=1 Tax=Glycomyces endophyticus TaxID=480996 RepID=A0ABN2HKZ1_9ACTN
MVTGMAPGPSAASSTAGRPTASAAAPHPARLWSNGPNERCGEVTLADAINAGALLQPRRGIPRGYFTVRIV